MNCANSDSKVMLYKVSVIFQDLDYIIIKVVLFVDKSERRGTERARGGWLGEAERERERRERGREKEERGCEREKREVGDGVERAREH